MTRGTKRVYSVWTYLETMNSIDSFFSRYSFIWLIMCAKTTFYGKPKRHRSSARRVERNAKQSQVIWNIYMENETRCRPNGKVTQSCRQGLTWWEAFEWSKRTATGSPFKAIGHCWLSLSVTVEQNWPRNLDHPEGAGGAFHAKMSGPKPWTRRQMHIADEL